MTRATPDCASSAANGLVVVPDETAAAARLNADGFDWRDAPASWQHALRGLAVVPTADWLWSGIAQRPP